VNLYLPLVTRR